MIYSFEHGGKRYQVDATDFLVDPGEWDEDFASGMAPRVRIAGGLTQAHWRAIRHIRTRFAETGDCPRAFETCRAIGLTLEDLKQLFPTGYQRGACKLAGITYRDGFAEAAARPPALPDGWAPKVDARGFLLDPAQWSEEYAVLMARRLGMARGLGPQHWHVIRFLRESFARDGEVPTVYATCEANGLSLDQLAHLFPTGYHRGAVLLAGLSAR
jgi:tRNA 2-thiouridine synthesizing protein E